MIRQLINSELKNIQLIVITLVLLCNPAFSQNPSDLDLAFQPAVFGDVVYGFHDPVPYTMAVQSDGKIIIGGYFVRYNGVVKNRIARLNYDGTLDNSFEIGPNMTGNILGDNVVKSIIIQPDGKIIIGGFFYDNAIFYGGIFRLNQDGSRDNSFMVGTNTNKSIDCMALQPDGKILIGGLFTSYNGTSVNHIVRLNSNGTLDNTFNIGTGFDNNISCIALQADGKILVGGGFTSYNGIAKNKIVRLNSNGTVDNTLKIGTGFSQSYDWVTNIGIHYDGRILVSGNFNNYNTQPVKSFFRLNPDGTIDRSFTAAIPASPQKFIILPGDKILMGGLSLATLIRLNGDGSVDNNFITHSQNYDIQGITAQPDGRILVSGLFNNYQNKGYNKLFRIIGDPSYYNKINGCVFEETNNDCLKNNGEKAIKTLVVKALPGPYYGSTDSSGQYSIKVDSGSVSYNVTQQYNDINSVFMENKCAISHTVALKGAFKDTSSFDFADTVKQCHLLNISIQATRMRRCFINPTYINYCNYGNSDAEGVRIKIKYPEYIIPVNSDPMWTYKDGDSVFYNLGTIPAGFCGKITLTDSVICGDENIRGFTQCIKANISPTSNCIEENPAWDRSSITVDGIALLDSSSFFIRNIGKGNMAIARGFRLYENDTLIYNGDIALKSGEQINVKYPNEGKTIRLEADQDPLHPGKSLPRAIVENSLTSPVAIPGGNVTTSPQDDLDEEIAITCNTIIDSYDPNDKQAMPSGIGAIKQIAPGEELEYTIRFQNTGTDTAYTVRVVDTLDVNLDVSSLTQGASSHPYSLGITGKGQAVLSFNFNYIKLPDSTTNKVRSQGLVSYRIKIQDGVSIGTLIHNKAYIYFDYNSPIITNETMHTLGTTIGEDLAKGTKVKVGNIITEINNKHNSLNLYLYPNPATDEINFRVNGATSKKYKLACMNSIGHQIGCYEFNIEEFRINITNYQIGIYFYTLKDENGNSSHGKFMIE
jgi:uncharacterized delta-60 repeat protein/uncharacterized repeat protein (TIGR01451 family)